MVLDGLYRHREVGCHSTMQRPGSDSFEDPSADPRNRGCSQREWFLFMLVLTLAAAAVLAGAYLGLLWDWPR